MLVLPTLVRVPPIRVQRSLAFRNITPLLTRFGYQILLLFLDGLKRVGTANRQLVVLKPTSLLPFLSPPIVPHHSLDWQPPPNNSPMPTVLLRISLICHLLNSLLHYFLPTKLSSLLARHENPAPGAAKLSPPCPSRRSPSGPRVFILATQPGMDPSELKRVFQMFDRNGDGRITKKELSDSLENLGIYIAEGDLEAMIEKIDANGDGCVDVEEFGALYQTIMDERDEEEDMREAFNVFDQNGDGFITVEELRSVLASLGIKQGRTIEDCRRMISKVDGDGDGRVNFKEFTQMMRGGGFAALG